MQVLFCSSALCYADSCFSRLELEEIARRATAPALAWTHVEESRVRHPATLLAAIRRHGALADDGTRTSFRSRLLLLHGCRCGSLRENSRCSTTPATATTAAAVEGSRAHRLLAQRLLLHLLLPLPVSTASSTATTERASQVGKRSRTVESTSWRSSCRGCAPAAATATTAWTVAYHSTATRQALQESVAAHATNVLQRRV